MKTRQLGRSGLTLSADLRLIHKVMPRGAAAGQRYTEEMMRAVNQ